MASTRRTARILPLLLVAALAMCSIGAPVASAQFSRVPPWRSTLTSPPTEARITVGQSTLTVQLAVTTAQQSLGLGYRNGLAPNTGMLFVFDAPQIQTFWMKGMRFCLDIVWVSSTEVVGAAESVCPDPPGIADADRPVQTSPAPVQYVLEVPAGWLKQHGYGAGTPVNLSALPATPAAFALPPL